MTRTLLASLVSAIALVAAGCGGSDESSASATADWADGFCTAITSWTDSIQTVSEQFSDPLSLSGDVLSEASSDVQSATEQLVDDLRGLGAPDTESGQAVEDSVDQLSTTLESETAKITEAAEGASGLTELPSAITSITASLSAMSTAFATTLQAVENADVQGELRTALEDSPACADITN